LVGKVVYFGHQSRLLYFSRGGVLHDQTLADVFR
jgi:hypothetical protein